MCAFALASGQGRGPGKFGLVPLVLPISIDHPVERQFEVRARRATIEETLFWVPQSGSVGLGISVLSYGGGVQFGVVSDATLCPDPHHIFDRFQPEFERLLLVALMMPWGHAVLP